MKKNEYGPASISLGSLEEWCQQHCAPPQDEDDAFVVDYCANYPDDDNDPSFRLVISTPRKELISDLDFLQVSMDKESFSKGLQLFKAKWSASEPD